MIKGAGQNAAQMKRMNRLRVLRLIRRGPVARSELAAETGLTRAAMSLIVTDLLNEGLLVEVGPRQSKGGRKAVLLELRPQYACAMGVNISRTGAEVGVIDLAGELLSWAPADVNPASRAATLLSIKQALRRVQVSGTSPESPCLGLGVSTPGPVDVMSGMILNPPNFEVWHGVKLCDELRGIAGGDVFLANNSQALTLAERARGKGRDFSNFILLVVDSGIGAGIIRDGELYTGWHGFGSELGHTSINYNGPECNCGLRGCVELYGATPAVLERARKTHPQLAKWEDFVDLAYTGDRTCRRLMDEQARAIATALVNSLNLLELEAVILTGDVLYRGEMIRASVERYVNQSAINRRLHRISVHLSSFYEHHELVAAAGIALEKFFHGELEPATCAALAPALPAR